MTKERMRVVIAEWCGWTHVGHSAGYGLEGYSPDHPLNKLPEDDFEDGPMDSVPDFCNDLNAIHEAALKLGPDKGSTYAMELRRIVVRDKTPDMEGLVVLQHEPSEHYLSDLYFYEATAPQRCEALIRTIGRWEDDK